MRKTIGMLAAAALLGGSLPARAADPSPDLIKQAAATAGGQVVMESALFDTTNNDFINGFNSKFGKDGLHLKLIRLQTTQQSALYDQELRANKVTTDIMFFVDPSLFLRFQRDNKLTPYCSANFKDYRPEAVGPECSYFYAGSYYVALGYNTDQVTTPPNSWWDLTDPKWKGRISYPDPKVGGGHYVYLFLLTKLFPSTWQDLMAKIRDNGVFLSNGFGLIDNQLMAGERAFGPDISVTIHNNGPYPGGKGAPVKEALAKEGTTLLPGGIGITKGSPNPAGAKVFVDWISSLDGQKVIDHNGLVSLRRDFTDREGDDIAALHYLWFDPDEMDKKRDPLTKQAEAILTAK